MISHLVPAWFYTQRILAFHKIICISGPNSVTLTRNFVSQIFFKSVSLKLKTVQQKKIHKTVSDTNRVINRWGVLFILSIMFFCLKRC